ncbi:hypothetical protein [Shouchella patagoniensis]|uniref:hypothetical protein n=1 Tax=Shouchella patagoniensis TaxID=228576 RepID=UPI001FE863CE|nr:hypothetical protein [Shouchella patagoniensis]
MCRLSTELILTMLSMAIWSALSLEMIKRKDKEGIGRKGFTLMYAGCLSTLILTFSLYQNLQF